MWVVLNVQCFNVFEIQGFGHFNECVINVNQCHVCNDSEGMTLNEKKDKYLTAIQKSNGILNHHMSLYVPITTINWCIKKIIRVQEMKCLTLGVPSGNTNDANRC